MTLLKGALIQVTDGVMAITPNVVVFQYNPASLSRTVTPFGAEESPGEQGRIAPGTQPYEPKETIDLTLELDGSDELGEADPFTIATGIAPRIAALEKMLRPTKGLLADIADAATALVSSGGRGSVPERPTVPIVFFMWGPSRILPVRLSTYTIEEQAFHPTLFPIRATVTVTLEVLAPSAFGCQTGMVVDIAKAAYRFHRLEQETLATTHFAKNIVDGFRLLV